MNEPQVVIIDSGIDYSHSIFTGIKINGMSILNGNIREEYKDEIGHGTGVASLIARKNRNLSLFIIKIIGKELYGREQDLLIALKYILDYIECNIIVISSGIVQSELKNDMELLCNQLKEKGCFIVSGMDNQGGISYPATFDSVLAVIGDKNCRTDDTYYYMENSPINYVAKGIAQTVVWINGESKYVDGSSFAVPHIVNQIIDGIRNNVTDYDMIVERLKKRATKIINMGTPKECKSVAFAKKIVLFPFNKEIYTLLLYKDLLMCEICGVYNLKYFGNIGINTNDIINGGNQIILNIDELYWDTEEFDTFVIGHCDEISALLGYSIKQKIIKQCLLYNKNLIAFDSKEISPEIFMRFEEKGLNISITKIDETNVPYNLLGRLFSYHIPILSVVGTSQKQGKFSLQLMLRREFLKNGYDVGQIGTEPMSLLFAFDGLYPIGYNSEVHIEGGKSISVINKMLYDIESKGKDIIIVGGQSCAMPYQIRNLQDIPYNSYEFLLGTDADAYLLCVNYEDSYNYISRTINYLESLTGGKVISIVLFPYRNRDTWSGIRLSQDVIETKELEIKRRELTKEFGIPVYINCMENEIKDLFETCVDYFQ